MKVPALCVLLFATAQAVDWANVKPVYRTQHTSIAASQRGKIIGGSVSSVGQFPYQVGIFLDGTGFCGGSLIAPDVILTAAHCAVDTSSFEVHLGAQNIYDESEPTRKIVYSNDGVPHKDYTSSTIHNDIALVRLSGPVSGPGIEPVRLPSYSMAGETFAGETVRVSGWGRTSESPGISSELMFVDVTVMANDVCNNYFVNINDKKICIDTNGGAEGVCNGDSGGPMVIAEKDGIYTEIGLVSFGSALGCEAGLPSVFTRVSEFVDWIAINGNVTIRP